MLSCRPRLKSKTITLLIRWLQHLLYPSLYLSLFLAPSVFSPAMCSFWVSSFSPAPAMHFELTPLPYVSLQFTSSVLLLQLICSNLWLVISCWRSRPKLRQPGYLPSLIGVGGGGGGGSRRLARGSECVVICVTNLWWFLSGLWDFVLHSFMGLGELCVFECFFSFLRFPFFFLFLFSLQSHKKVCNITCLWWRVCLKYIR